jgi:DNA-binding transcriptional LysR family regulator
MGTPSLRQLDIFAQMVASGSVVRCARDLGVSVEAVERDVASLEMRLGYKLFDRDADRAQLTVAGRKTVRAMTMLSESAPESWEVSAEIAPSPIETGLADDRQQVVIAAPAPVFGHFQDALTAFEDTNADVAITLDLSVQTAEDAAATMQRGTADIVYFYALGESVAFPSRYVWSEQLILYLGTNHPLARQETIDLVDLAAVAPVTMEPRNGLRRIIEQALDKAGLVRSSPALETDNLFDIMTAVREGAGYFAAFGPLARDFGRMPDIRRLPLACPLPPIEVRQAVRDAVRDDPMTAAIAEYLFR